MSTSSGKSSSRTKGGTSSAGNKPSTTRTLSSPSSLSHLASPTTSKVSSGSDGNDHSGSGDDSNATPRRTSTPGGSRTNLLWPHRDRTDSIREEDEGDTTPTQASQRQNRPDSNGDRFKATGDSTDGERLRKLSGSRRNPQPKVPLQDSTDGISGEEDGEREGRRESVIEKVAHRAKFGLPLRRAKDGGLERAEGLARKTTTTVQASSLQRSEGMAQTSRVSADQLQDGKIIGKSPSVSRTIPIHHKNLPTPLPTQTNGGFSLNPDGSHRRAASPTASLSPEGTATSRNVSPGLAPDRGVDERQDTQATGSAVFKRSNKIINLSTSDLNLDPGAETMSSKPPALSPTLRSSSRTGARRQPSMNSINEGDESGTGEIEIPPTTSDQASQPISPTSASVDNKPSTLRSTSALKINSISSNIAASSTKILRPSNSPVPQRERRLPTKEPPMPEVDEDMDEQVKHAPASGMYWSKAPCFGYYHHALRAHTTTLVGGNIYVFGGCDSQTCFNDLYMFDADCMYWIRPDCTGEAPPALRAMTATALGKKIIIFGGGDGPAYYNDVYVLDTVNRRYTKPKIRGPTPCIRRAHTACLYKSGIYVFGGGDGVKALNDVWRLDITNLTRPSWKLVSPAGKSSNLPTARGYHTANIVGTKLIIFGGSDGQECFRDVWMFDVESYAWRSVKIDISYPRLSHTATVVGSYLFVIGGHDGVEYSSDVLLLNLVTMQWDKRTVYGKGPSGRGYHGTILYDSRLFVIGGFDG